MTGEFFEIAREALGGLDVDFDVLYLSSYDVGEVSRALSTVGKPDIALLSLMGDNTELLSLFRDWLRETRVVFTLSTGLETVMLTRVYGHELGSYVVGAVSPQSSSTGSSYFDPRTLSMALHLIAKSLQGEVARYVEDWALLIDYWRNWRRENIINMLRLVLRNYCGVPAPEPQPPIELGEYWFEDVGGVVYRSLGEYLARAGGGGLPVVLLAYSGQSYFKARRVATYVMGRVGNAVTLFSNYGYT